MVIKSKKKKKKKTTFVLETFLESPSLEKLNNCRVDDLTEIAVHFNVSFAKPILKRDLKTLVLVKLVELGLIDLPVLPESPEGVPGSTGVASPKPMITTHAAGEEASGRSGRPATPYTSPRFDHLSSGSGGPLAEARLKVRQARLQMEAQEKAESRQAQLQLEIRKMEIEADKAVRLLSQLSFQLS